MGEGAASPAWPRPAPAAARRPPAAARRPAAAIPRPPAAASMQGGIEGGGKGSFPYGKVKFLKVKFSPRSDFLR